jgi:hypothetical protein
VESWHQINDRDGGQWREGSEGGARKDLSHSRTWISFRMTSWISCSKSFRVSWRAFQNGHGVHSAGALSEGEESSRGVLAATGMVENPVIKGEGSGPKKTTQGRPSKFEQRSSLRIRGGWRMLGNRVQVSPDGGAEEHGTAEQGNTG